MYDAAEKGRRRQLNVVFNQDPGYLSYVVRVLGRKKQIYGREMDYVISIDDVRRDRKRLFSRRPTAANPED